LKINVGLGQDSHRIVDPGTRPFVLGGVRFEVPYSLEGNSDSDVILHAITNAVSGITGRPILGPVADGMCKAGVIDSREYLRVALDDLKAAGYAPSHVSVSIECARPKILPALDSLRASVAGLLGLAVADVGITATTGEGLTDFGRGLGVQAFAVLTVEAAAG
jgi:2-C-methyl-D-erythritol 2,4-cyclodiphosphate synthase